jgi:hypothetical protein
MQQFTLSMGCLSNATFDRDWSRDLEMNGHGEVFKREIHSLSLMLLV